VYQKSLIKLIKKTSFFSNSEFGYLDDLLTTNALFKLDNFVCRYIVVNYKVVGIFLDVPKDV